MTIFQRRRAIPPRRMLRNNRWRHSLRTDFTAGTANLPALDLLATERKWPSQYARTWVAAFAENVCGDANTEALVLIGSIARPVSQVADVDLLYVYRDQPIDFRDHPLDVDIRAYAKDHFLERLAS